MLLATAREDSLLCEDAVFVPEMCIRPGQQQAFQAEAEAFRFVEDETLRVLLIQGGAGSGKSLFCSCS